MKLVSFAIDGLEGFGAITESGVIGLSGRLSGRQQTVRDVLESNALDEARAAIEGVEPDYPVNEIKFLLPIPNPKKYTASARTTASTSSKWAMKFRTRPVFFRAMLVHSCHIMAPWKCHPIRSISTTRPR